MDPAAFIITDECYEVIYYEYGHQNLRNLQDERTHQYYRNVDHQADLSNRFFHFQRQNLRQKILKMDPAAFIITDECYEVSGGTKYAILPF